MHKYAKSLLTEAQHYYTMVFKNTVPI